MMMIIGNMDKLMALTGVIMGIEIVAVAIFMLSLLYLRNPQIAGIIGNLSSLSMTSALIAAFLKRA